MQLKTALVNQEYPRKGQKAKEGSTVTCQARACASHARVSHVTLDSPSVKNATKGLRDGWGSNEAQCSLLSLIRLLVSSWFVCVIML